VSENTDIASTGRTPRDDRFYLSASHTPQVAPELFRGLTPRISAHPTAPHTGVTQATAKTLRNSLPLLMTGSLAAGVGVTSSIPVYAETADSGAGAATQRTKASFSELISQAFIPLSHRVVTTVAPHIPDTYTVRRGDTLSNVAEKFGIPTALLLTLNGLNWNSILHEGQIVKLTTAPGKEKGMAPARASEQRHLVRTGDTLATVAQRYGISISALADANSLQPSDQVFPGESLIIPGTRADTAPKVVEAASSQSPRIVFASTTDEPEELTEASSDEDAAVGDENTAPPSNQEGDPVEWQIAAAPELRVVAPAPKPAPAPAPVAPAKPQPKVAEKEEDDSDEETVAETPAKPVSGAITPLNDTRRANASVIVQVGRDLGVPDYGIVIALATAMQESSLRNINWGDRDSVGLYQQRPSSGWGSVDQIMDPVYATKAFFGGPSNPNPGKTRGLLDYSGWESMSLTVAAQKVQRSAYPEAYAKWEASAWAWLDELS
jgi:LysM repeat protein